MFLRDVIFGTPFLGLHFTERNSRERQFRDAIFQRRHIRERIMDAILASKARALLRKSPKMRRGLRLAFGHGRRLTLAEQVAEADHVKRIATDSRGLAQINIRDVIIGEKSVSNRYGMIVFSIFFGRWAKLTAQLSARSPIRGENGSTVG